MTLIPGVPAPLVLLNVFPLPTSTVEVNDVSSEHEKNDGKPVVRVALHGVVSVGLSPTAAPTELASTVTDVACGFLLTCRAWLSATVRLAWARLKSPLASPLLVT